MYIYIYNYNNIVIYVYIYNTSLIYSGLQKSNRRNRYYPTRSLYIKIIRLLDLQQYFRMCYSL